MRINYNLKENFNFPNMPLSTKILVTSKSNFFETNRMAMASITIPIKDQLK